MAPSKLILEAQVSSEGCIVLLHVLTYHKDMRPCWHCEWPLSGSVAISESPEGPSVALPQLGLLIHSYRCALMNGLFRCPPECVFEFV